MYVVFPMANFATQPHKEKDMFSVAEIAQPQFVNDGLARIPGGAAFIYLFRRYGPPHYYSHKTVAGYELEFTPGAFLDFSIKHETCWLGVTAVDKVRREYETQANETRGRAYTPFCADIHTAFRTCLADQLRPVSVDGEPINIFGPGEFEFDEETETWKNEVPYFELEKINV